MCTRLSDLEQSTRDQIASNAQIKRWIGDGFLSFDQAVVAFPGWADTAARDPGRSATDYTAILAAYESYALVHSKAHDPNRKTHLNNMSRARQVVEWLRANFPDLRPMSVKDCERFVADLQERYSQWSVHHHLTMLRILLDQAIDMGMISENPARSLRMGNPKIATVRRVLSGDEPRMLLEASLKYPQWIYGGLPTAIRFCLYAGLRPEEVCWVKSSWLNVRPPTLTIQETRDAGGQIWTPKDYEARVLDVNTELLEWLQKEKHDGPFVLRSKEEGRPLNPSSLSHAFRKIADAEGWDRSITLYSCRHTYCTELLRAGVDLATVQRRMGHESVRTTQTYLHALGGESPVAEKLPY
jgi:integrase